MKVNEIVTGILSVTDMKDLKILQGAINTQLRAIQAEARKEFAIGDKVSFTSRGSKLYGSVTKLNPKTVVVNCMGRTWRVSPTLLTKEN